MKPAITRLLSKRQKGELVGSSNAVSVAELANGIYYFKANGQVFKFVKY